MWFSKFRNFLKKIMNPFGTQQIKLEVLGVPPDSNILHWTLWPSAFCFGFSHVTPSVRECCRKSWSAARPEKPDVWGTHWGLDSGLNYRAKVARGWGLQSSFISIWWYVILWRSFAPIIHNHSWWCALSSGILKRAGGKLGLNPYALSQN